MPLRCHLRQVGHGQYLAALAQPAQQLADDLGGRATDADVHLVEHQRRDARGLRGDHLDGQADARQLAARCHFGQALERLPRVGADQQFDLLQAVR
ncbi:hypothetical protein D3C79_612470 [compost metagenome]